MKQLKVLLAVLMALSLILAGCAPAAAPSDASQSETKPAAAPSDAPQSETKPASVSSDASQPNTEPSSAPDAPAPDDGVWKTVCGNYAWDESSQYTNSILYMMWLDDGCVLFEFNLMKGSEEEDSATDLTVSGVLNVQKDGSGLYEAVNDEGESSLKIQFDISEDGTQVAISHEGELPISPDGNYIFTDSNMEVSDYSATELVRYLPTVATSLNSNLGAYTLNHPESLVSGWFYPIDATFNDSGEYLAKFIVAKDLSAVFRVDDDIEPVLIYGSAQPMMDAEVWPEFDDEDEEGSGEEPAAEISYDPYPLVSVGVDNGTFLTVGESDALLVNLPWELPFTLKARSADTSIVDVDENGVITVVAPGETSIIGTLTVEDGVKEFEININVLDEEGAVG